MPESGNGAKKSTGARDKATQAELNREPRHTTLKHRCLRTRQFHGSFTTVGNSASRPRLPPLCYLQRMILERGNRCNSSILTIYRYAKVPSIRSCLTGRNLVSARIQNISHVQLWNFTRRGFAADGRSPGLQGRSRICPPGDGELIGPAEPPAECEAPHESDRAPLPCALQPSPADPLPR